MGAGARARRYSAGDTQFKGMRSINQGSGMYWKTSKNFADGNLPHIVDSVFASGGGPAAHGSSPMVGPSGAFTFLIENTHWLADGSVHCAMCAGQHCGLSGHNYGTQGTNCAVHYVVKNCTFHRIQGTRGHIQFGASGRALLRAVLRAVCWPAGTRTVASEC